MQTKGTDKEGIPFKVEGFVVVMLDNYSVSI